MPKANNSAKTAWVPKYWQLATCLIILMVVVFGWRGTAKAPASTVVIHNHTFTVEYADTPAQQAKGLGGRASWPADHVMLFRFDAAAQRCFWMKNMRFSLDIIWISPARKIVHIEPNVSPLTYPKTFCPSTPAQYVLEINAGTANQLNLRAGDSISF